MKRLIIVLLSLLLVSCQPTVIRETEYIPVESVIIKTVEVEKFTPARDFTDLSELQEWLNKNTTLYLAPDENGVLTLVNHIPTDKDDCDDQALGFQQKALDAGYIMSVHLVENGRIFGVKVTEFTENHMGNLAVIGNDVYYIEPTSGEITFIVTRD